MEIRVGWHGKKGYGVGDIWGAGGGTARLDRVAREGLCGR